MLVFAHGGTLGLVLETVPVLVIAVVITVIIIRDRRNAPPTDPDGPS